MDTGAGPRVDTGPVVTAVMSTKAEGGLELMLVLWPLPECLWRLKGASS